MNDGSLGVIHGIDQRMQELPCTESVIMMRGAKRLRCSFCVDSFAVVRLIFERITSRVGFTERQMVLRKLVQQRRIYAAAQQATNLVPEWLERAHVCLHVLRDDVNALCEAERPTRPIKDPRPRNVADLEAVSREVEPQ